MSGPRVGGPLALVLLLSLVMLAPAARALAQGRQLAEPFAPPPDDGVSLDLQVGTLAPLLVGGGVRVNLPGQLIVGVLAGGTPSAYGEVFGDAAAAYGAPSGVSELVSRFLGGAFVLRIEAGVRPVAHAGLELLVHYSAMFSAPEISTGAIDQLAGQPIPWPAGITSVQLDGVLHGFGGELAWALEPVSGLLIRLALGLTYFGGASMRVVVPQELRAAAGGQIEAVERRIASTFTTYGVVPYAGLTAGWRIH